MSSVAYLSNITGMHYPRLIKFEVLWVFNSFKTLLELSLSAEF